MSLLTQAHLLDKYGPRLNSEQVAEVFGITVAALHNKVSEDKPPCKMYKHMGRLWADYRDVSAALDDLRTLAA